MSHLPYQMLAKKAMSVAQSKVCNFHPCIVWVCTSSTGGLLISTTLLNQPLILHLHHHFLQTRLAGSCAAELQAHTVFRK